MRVVLYIRVSTTEQAEEGYSIRAQHTQLIDYCRVNDYEVVNFFIDDGYSAKDMKRPDLRKLLEAAQNGEFDAVVVYKLDRFTRSVRDLYTLLDELNKYNVGFISKQEKFDTTTAIGRAMIGLIAVFAQFERELISERVRMAQEQMLKEGKRPAGRIPYGYSSDGIIIEEEAEDIRYLRNLYMNEKLSFVKIAARMNREGKLRRGYDWTSTSVSYTLQNPYYAGIIEYGEKLPDGTYPKLNKKNSVRVLSKPGSHEPIFTVEELEEQVKRASSRSVSGYSSKAIYWFNGIIRCGRCGFAMTGGLSHNKKNDGNTDKVPYYFCSRKKHNNSCTMPLIRQHHVMHLLNEHIEKLQIDHEIAESARKDVTSKVSETEREIKKYKRELVDAKERLKKWQYMFVEGLITSDVLRDRLGEEHEREEAIKSKLEDLMAIEPETIDTRNKLFSMMELWPHINDMDKKDLIQSIFEEITICTDVVNPKGVKNKYYDASIKVKYQ